MLEYNCIISALWLQNILILSTLIVTIVVFLFKNEHILIFQIFMVLSYKFQYSGENYHFFEHNSILYYGITYGRFLETFPNSLSGFLIASFGIPSNLKMYKQKAIILSLIILIFCSINHFDEELLGFKYGGIRKNFAAIFIFCLFFFALDNVKTKVIIKLLNIITNYTAGIYFIHEMVGTSFMIKFILGNKINTFFGNIIIYLRSYMLCHFIDKFIGNSKLKHLIK